MSYFKLLILLTLPAILLNCGTKIDLVKFEEQSVFYSNLEGNNSIEGKFINARKISGDTLYFSGEIDAILHQIDRSWAVGQGSGKPYYDSGKEYLYNIIEIITEKRAIIISSPDEYLSVNKPFVFWKLSSYPVLFSDSLKGSWGFSKIIKDPKDNIFKTHLFECDTDKVSLYLAESSDLSKWDIQKVLSPNDFRGIKWNAAAPDGWMRVTPLISDVIFHNNKYYSFAYGDDHDEKTYIGLLSSDSLEGNYKVFEEPILSPNPNSSYSNHDVYFPKVVKAGENWLMFYTAKNDKNEEFLSCASSENLIQWTTIKENIIPRNKGWNAALYNQVCAQIALKRDSITLWITGAKDVGDYERPNKGNVMDACIGKFIAHKDSLIFSELQGNPIFGGNPVFDFENDHIGAAFQELNHEGYTYTFYHGKGRSSKNYTILLR